MRKSWTILGACGLTLGLVLFAQADEKIKVQVAPPNVKVEALRTAVEARVNGRIAAGTTRAMRSSKLIGMEVKNATGDSLGKINDLVIDEKGSVRYVAMSHGGLLGVGSKLFAIPYRAMQLKTSIDNDTHYFELHVDKALLEKAPGFASDKWPDFADEAFTKEVDGFYLNIGEVKLRLEGR